MSATPLSKKLVWGPTHKKLDWYQAMDLQRDGWSVPTIKRLKQAVKDLVPGFEKTWYWSSREGSSSGFAWNIHFGDGRTDSDKKSKFLAVRMVRPISCASLNPL